MASASSIATATALKQPFGAGRRAPVQVSIRGSGVAARCSQHLLARSGIDARLEEIGRGSRPAVLLSDAAVALMRDCLGQPGLFADRHRLRRRIVSWGGGEPVVLEHGAIVLGAADLDEAIAPTLSHCPCEPIATAPEVRGFTIHAAAPFPAPAQRRFGERRGQGVPVRLLHPEEADACWIEAVEAGWLFMVPSGEERGWLLGVGGAIDLLLDQSRHLARRIAVTAPARTGFETAPLLLAQSSGADWLACGTDAIAFDPICGDGTAQAVREAILAAAVVAGIGDGGDAAALLAHYHAMLLAAMRRHLRLCGQFYQSGGDGPWWRVQLAALSEGFDWCTAQLAALPEPAFVLRGFRLVPRSEAG